MEHFIVSARKYRPKTFKDVVGQQAITNTLLNAIENNHLAQALLFTGPRGVGKTSCARILAKQINQQEGEVNENEDFAFNIFELDAASNNSVDDIRNLIDQVRIPPQVGKYKVYIIDEVHMLSSAAFNAFLKTLEEPPKHAIFILATTEKHKIIPTILSRCQIFDFKRITVNDAKEYLAHIAQEQGVEAEDDALHIIAQKADGAMRDALSIFDRVVSFSGKQLTRQAVTENLNVLDYEVFFKSTDLILSNNIPELLLLFNNTLAKGFEGQHYIAGLASHFRDLLVCKDQSTINLLEVGEQTKQKYLEQSQAAPYPFLLEAIEKANSCDLNYRTSRNQRLLVELCLMQLASITFEAEKKKSKDFIIPASFFIGVHPPIETKNEKAIVSEVTQEEMQSEPVVQEQVQEVVKSKPKPELTTTADSKKISGLSLKSIREKNTHKKLQEEKSKIDQLNLPKEEFSKEDFENYWHKYIDKLNKKGGKIIASILEVDKPKLEGTKIHLEFPNETMKVELDRAKGSLLEYLRKKLRNYSIDLSITINEEAEKKYAYSTREKYEKLKEINPLIDKLRIEFGLDID
ncbi:MAG: DNA polymerase III subunit gamma/tau [Flavobacteriaceae bacterium]|nr:DNA polymerase III subunit gamma/tau [Flavobacteriaceae bacterium]